jgi:hypothetical protein
MAKAKSSNRSTRKPKVLKACGTSRHRWMPRDQHCGCGRFLKTRDGIEDTQVMAQRETPHQTPVQPGYCTKHRCHHQFVLRPGVMARYECLACFTTVAVLKAGKYFEPSPCVPLADEALATLRLIDAALVKHQREAFQEIVDALKGNR